MHGSLGWSCSESGMRKTAFQIGATLPICHPQGGKHFCLRMEQVRSGVAAGLDGT